MPPAPPSSPSSPAWRSVVIAATTMATQNGVLNCFAVFYVALLEEFGWGRGPAAGIQSFSVFIIGFSAPLIGYLLDRYGPRALFPSGALLTAAGLFLAANSHTLWEFYLWYGILAGLGQAALTSFPNMVVVSKWFPRRVGRTIALADLGTGVGVFLLVPAVQLLTLEIGWRGSLILLSGFLALILGPLNLFQRVPSSRTPSTDNPFSPTPPSDWTLTRALRTIPFWALALARLFSGVAFIMVSVHMVAYVSGLQFSKVTAATALGTISLVSLGGRLLVGTAADRIGRERALTFAYGSTALGILSLIALATWPHPLLLAAAVLFYGLGQGSGGIVISAKAADLFQGRSFGTIYGWISMTTGIGEGLGAWLAGYVFDKTGSYTGGLLAAVGALVLGVAAVWTAGVTGRILQSSSPSSRVRKIY